MLPSGPCEIPGYPGIPGFFQNPDPGILKNLIPGFFGDFQKPLNNYILRLSTPFIDHNNLFWDIWSLQEGQKSFWLLNFWFFSNQYSTWTYIAHSCTIFPSTGWWLYIWGCRLQTVPWGSKLSKEYHPKTPFRPQKGSFYGFFTNIRKWRLHGFLKFPKMRTTCRR